MTLKRWDSPLLSLEVCSRATPLGITREIICLQVEALSGLALIGRGIIFVLLQTPGGIVIDRPWNAVHNNIVGIKKKTMMI